MEATLIKSVQVTENLTDLFKKRHLRKIEINDEITSLRTKITRELEENKEVVLFTVNPEETIVFLGEQLRHNCYIGIHYPEAGLFLRKIEFVFRESVTDFFLEYLNDIIIKFEFNIPEFNGEMSLKTLGFNDIKNRISQQIPGLGFNPQFADSGKYMTVRDTLREIREKIFQIKV